MKTDNGLALMCIENNKATKLDLKSLLINKLTNKNMRKNLKD